MSGEIHKEIELKIAHVLFVDIVGYSKLAINDQRAAIETLKEIVRGSEAFQRAEAVGRLIKIPTGDGMALVFHDSPEEPLDCALEISRALQDDAQLRLRMGIHSGPVSGVVDVNEGVNVAGGGINMAQRVMDCGDAGHILLSKRVADDLEQYPHWKPHLHHLGTCRVKHGVRLEVVNLFTNELGNRAVPGKFRRAQRRRITTLAGVILLIGGLAAAALIYTRKPIAAIPEKSIAVLPFENLSEDKGNAYFAAGIQDEILTRLANLGGLKVIARTSVEKYQSHPANLAAVAAELGVAHILEGSVQKLGNEVHVNVQLIKASTAAHVWAQSYDRTLERAFAVQGEVAQTVATALRVALAPAQIEKLNSLPTQNPAAYDAFLRGEYALDQAWKNGDYQKSFDPAIASFQEAVAADPQFALAYARLGYAELTKEEFAHKDGRAVHKPELLVSAKQNVDRALQLQPGLAAGHFALGRWHSAAKQDREAALMEYHRALELDPRLSDATIRIAGIALNRGHPEDAVELLRKGSESDPLNYQLLRNLSLAYSMRREYQRAFEVDSRILAMNPGDETDTFNLCNDIFQTTGDLREARRVLDGLIAQLPAGKPKSIRITTLELFLFVLNRDFAAAKNYADSIPLENWETDWSREQTLGDIARFAGEKESSRSSYQNARVLLMAAIAKDPEEPQSHADLSMVDAGLGLDDEALREAERAIELEPLEKNARMALGWLVNRVVVQTRLGKTDDAIHGIEQLMAIPYAGEVMSACLLKINPDWDPLRNDSRFRKLADTGR
jgi:serine/threonine-protein kinase